MGLRAFCIDHQDNEDVVFSDSNEKGDVMVEEEELGLQVLRLCLFRKEV